MSSSMLGIDAAWLAVDSLGCVGIFFTGGQGPIPAAALAVLQSGLDPEAVLLMLGERGGCEVLVKYRRPDDFVLMANRGLYAFDWSDVHRTIAREIGVYELVAIPSSPVGVCDLPESIQRAARSVQYGRVSFQECSKHGLHVVGA
jgi:hypothetical protein